MMASGTALASGARSGALWPLHRKGYWIAIPLVALAYSGVASVSLMLAIPPGYASAVWPPAGIALAAWLAFGGRIWPGIFLGAALANLGVMGTTPVVAMAIGLGNAAEAAVAGLLVRRFVRLQHRFEEPRGVWHFTLIAFCAALVAATNGVLTLALAGQVPWAEFGRHWLTWWLGDATGIVIVAPLLLAWSEPRAARPGFEAQLFAWLLALGAALVAAGGFAGGSVHTLAYLLIPFVVWAASRLDQRAVTAASFAISAVAVLDMLDGAAALFAPLALNASLLLLQLFVSAVAVSGLVLAARAAALERLRARLEAAREELELRLKERSDTLLEVATERAEFARRALRARDEERRRVAAELHDRMAQDLSSLLVSLDMLRQQLPATTRLAAHAEQAAGLARRAGRALRELMVGLLPAEAEDPWLTSTLRRHAAAFEQRTGIVVQVTAVPAAVRVAPRVKETLVRVFLEALNNVRRHSDAHSVRVALELKPGRVVMRIEDDGRGFDPARVAASRERPTLGLQIMRERVLALNGELRLIAAPGAGTRLEVSLAA